MTESDLVAAFLDGNVVQNAAPQARTNGTIRLAFGNQSFNYRIGVALDNPERNIELAEVCRQHFRRKSRLFLVQIDGEKLKIHGRALADVEQKVQQPAAVFAARETAHNAIAVFNHPKIGDWFAHSAQ